MLHFLFILIVFSFIGAIIGSFFNDR